MKNGLFCLFVLCSLACPVFAGNTDEKIFFPGEPSFGAQIFGNLNGKEMVAVGAKWARIDIVWSSIEKGEKGKYDFSHLDKQIAHYVDNGMNILGLLGYHYHCPLYSDPKEDMDAAIKGYADFARACVERYKGKVAIWELGNEPEVFSVYKKPADYTRLARAAAKAVREVDKDVHVGVLSTAWMDRPFILSSLQEGLLSDGTVDV
ncbi:MAG: hypothetical protein DRH10_07740, partial [Deltaproteobacteria bacterium]